MENKFLIWSNEHNSWWCPNSLGYTDFVDLAGRYSFDEALKICNGANYNWDMDRRNRIPDELPILESIAIKLKSKIKPTKGNK